MLLPSVASASSFSPTTSYPEDVLHERARLGTPTHAKQRQTHDEGEQCPKEKDRSLKTAPCTVEIRRHRERVFDSCSPAYSFLRRFILCLFFFFTLTRPSSWWRSIKETERGRERTKERRATRVAKKRLEYLLVLALSRAKSASGGCTQ